MTRDEMFDIWAPDGARWSPWVKPVLFAFLPRELPDLLEPAPEVLPAWLPAAGNTALVLDLPGPYAVWYGVLTAHLGYQPVPVFVAVPEANAQVDVWPVLYALQEATARRAAASLPSNAPPAFLLHGERREGRARLEPGSYDNRSVVLTTDFPSATTLLGHGITRVLLLHRGQVESDLAHVLRHWQDGGLSLEGACLPDVPPTALSIKKPSTFGLWWYRVLETMGLRRHILGGFGGYIPEPTGGGG